MEREIDGFMVVPANRVKEFAEKGYELYGDPFFDAAQHIAVQGLVKYAREIPDGEWVRADIFWWERVSTPPRF